MKNKSQKKQEPPITESDVHPDIQDGLEKEEGPDPRQSDKETPMMEVQDADSEIEGTEKQSSTHDLCEEKLSMMEAKLEEANDKFLRLFSEFDNYRKRTARERLELTKTATADIITALLPVLDDLERAANLTGDEGGSETGKQGLLLIASKFKTILRQKGVEEIHAIGEPFSTDYHEAVTHVPAEKETDKGLVVDEIQKGYLLNGKVIRYARVVVAN